MISVVVPAYNEEKYISNCLNSLVNQKTKYDFEVIVVNNNSTDKTAVIARSFKNKLKIRVILEKKKGRGSARYTGFKSAKGEIILSTDADTVVPADWINKLASALNDKDVVAVTGACKINDLTPVKNKIFNVSHPRVMFSYRVLFGHFWLSGFNFGIKKKAYIESGGFNPDMNAVEDIDLSIKVSQIGKIKFVDCPVVFSGRRYKKGFISANADYVKEYVKLRKNKVNKIWMDDPR
jgi:poly-beta-1,6-N-acetyl-D-glucosamine synthase